MAHIMELSAQKQNELIILRAQKEAADQACLDRHLAFLKTLPAADDVRIKQDLINLLREWYATDFCGHYYIDLWLSVALSSQSMHDALLLINNQEAKSMCTNSPFLYKRWIP